MTTDLNLAPDAIGLAPRPYLNEKSPGKKQWVRAVLLVICTISTSCGVEQHPTNYRPSAISDLEAMALNDSTINLRWTAPTDGDGGSVSGYDIRFALRADILDSTGQYANYRFFESPLDPGEPEAQAILGLSRDEKYYFSVRGRDDEGLEGPASNIAQAATYPDTIPPGKITDLRIVDRTKESFLLQWTAPGDDEARGRASRYRIRFLPWRADSTEFGVAQEIRPPNLPVPAGVTDEATVNGLAPRRQYSIAISAIDEAEGESVISNIAIGVTDRAPQDWRVEVDGSGDAPTIQAAIDSTRPGETVLIGPGRYFENVLIREQSESLRGVRGATVTIIDGSSNHTSVIQVRQVMSDAVTVCGLTLTGGSGSRVFDDQPESHTAGGGIFAQDASITICHCNISSNGVSNDGIDVTDTGGGVYGERRYGTATPECLVNECIVSDNVARRNGGGIAIAYLARPTISSCEIRDNMTMMGDGGGVWLLGCADDAEIASCQIIRNNAADHGGGVHVANTHFFNIRIVKNVIAANKARQLDGPFTEDVGAGIWISEASGVIDGNTIVRNAAPDDGTLRGGGVSIRTVRDLVVTRNIIAFTEHGTGIACVDGGDVKIRNNMFWPADQNHFAGCMVGIGSDGNVEQDPQFCNPSSDLWPISDQSPALTSEAGRIGADTPVGCRSGESSNWR